MNKKIALVPLLALLAITAGCGKDNQSQSESSVASSVLNTTVADTSATSPTNSSEIKSFTINDSKLGEITLKPFAGVAVNTLRAEDFTEVDGRIAYKNGDSQKACTGIDISSYSGDIDWEKVRANGVEFAMVRLGGRGYGESGELYPDDRAAEYIAEAKQAGIKVGAYFFSQAITAEEAVEEADYAVGLLNGQTLDFPLAYDWETIEDDTARTDGASSQTVTDCAKAFCDRVKSLGFTPMIYSESEALYYKYDLSKLSSVDIWYSEYQPSPNFYYEFSMWQYSSSGKIDGIEGNVDLNLCFTDLAEYY